MSPAARAESHRTVLSSAEHGGRRRLGASNRFVTVLGVRDRVQAVVLAYESGIAIPGKTS